MFDEMKERIISFFTSRLTIFTLVFLILGGVLIYRCFDLQIVHGQEYLDNFVLETERPETLPAPGAIFSTGTGMYWPTTSWPIR